MDVPAKLFGVLGDPVAHSRSPAMHNAAFAAMGMPHRYLAFHVTAADLEQALRGAHALGFGGLNLTVPHKRAALAHMDGLADDARRIGAVNTVSFDSGKILGHNTDGWGFMTALGELGAAPQTAAVLGSGGAARAVVDALAQAGARVWWVSRDPRALDRDFGAEPMDYPSLPDALENLELVVNATTVGMSNGPAKFPVEVDCARLPTGATVIDLVYPRPSGGLLDLAAAAGCGVQDGIPMLHWQGVRALELWTGDPLPDHARRAMREALM